MDNKLMLAFVALLLLAMPIAVAQERTAMESNKTPSNEGAPGLIAKHNATTNATAEEPKDYTVLQQVLDRIRLVFTFQEQRKAALINEIEQKREQHYQFLLSKGKTDQANKFLNQTIGLEKNFAQWKAQKNQILSRFEENVVNMNKTSEKPETANESNKTSAGKGLAERNQASHGQGKTG